MVFFFFLFPKHYVPSLEFIVLHQLYYSVMVHALKLMIQLKILNNRKVVFWFPSVIVDIKVTIRAPDWYGIHAITSNKLDSYRFSEFDFFQMFTGRWKFTFRITGRSWGGMCKAWSSGLGQGNLTFIIGGCHSRSIFYKYTLSWDMWWISYIIYNGVFTLFLSSINMLLLYMMN